MVADRGRKGAGHRVSRPRPKDCREASTGRLSRCALRLAGEVHAAELLRWRNDPETRLYRDDPKIIEPDEHLSWLRRRQASRSRVFIFFNECTPVGNVTIDTDDIKKRVEIGWIVAPEWRRKGLGRAMIEFALPAVTPPNYRPWAKVREDNTASLRVALATGFVESGKIGNMVHFDHPKPPTLGASPLPAWPYPGIRPE